MENKQKKRTEVRLIAKMVYKVSAVVLLASAVAGVCTSLPRHNARLNLQEKKVKVYNSFKSTDEFKQAHAQDLMKISEQYVYNNGTYEEFEKDLEYINSQEYVEKIISGEHKEQIEQIDKEIEKIDNNTVANVASVIFAGTMLPSATSMAIGMAVEASLDDKISIYEK